MVAASLLDTADASVFLRGSGSAGRLCGLRVFKVETFDESMREQG